MQANRSFAHFDRASSLLLALIGSILSCVLAHAADPPWQEPVDVAFTARCDGSTQRYVVMLPQGLDTSQPVDLLVALHGHGSDRWQFIRDQRDECRALRDAAARYGMIFVSPDYRAATSWMGPQAEADVLQILDELQTRYPLRHILVSGGSMGASSALTFAALHPRRVDGVVALNGTANHVEYEGFQDAIASSFGGTKTEVPDEYRRRSAELMSAQLTIPMAATVGGRDRSVPPDSVRRLFAERKADGRSVLLIDRPDGGHATDYADTLAAASFVITQVRRPVQLFVATDGNDAWSGTSPSPNAQKDDGPFATLDRARDEIRRRKAEETPPGGFVVSVRGGKYYLPATFVLQQEDTGTDEAPVVYRAFRDEQPVLIGGRAVGGFQPYRGDILQADLAAQGLENLTFTKQLFCGGDRQILARYPNFDAENPYAGGWAYADGEPIPMYQNIPDESQSRLTLKPEDLRDWARPTDGWVFVFPRYNWWNNWLPIESLDRETREVRLKGSASYPIRPNDRYYLYNLFEELDAPGEWYIDYGQHTLYFWPPGESSAWAGEVVLPTLPGIIQGKNLRHVTVHGFTIECCQGDAVRLVDCTDCRVAGCTIRNTQDAGVSVSGGMRCGVIGCDIYAVGTHGVQLSGGDRDTLTAAEHFAENNYIHHTGVYYKQGVGIGLSGVGNRASRNYIHDCPRFAVLYGGNDQIIELNHMRHLNLETCDTGATYCGGRDWLSPRGSVVRYNYIHDVFGFGKEHHHTGRWITPHYCWGVYLDDNSAETQVYGNIVVRALRGLLHFHCARDNLVENNIFVDGMLQQIEMNGWNDYSRWIDQMGPAYEKYSKLPAWQKYEGLQRGGHPDSAIPMGGNRIFRNIIYYSDPDAMLYKYRSSATRFLDDFTCDRNLVWHKGGPLLIGGLTDVPADEQWDKWRELGFDRSSVVADPLFVDPAKDDYRLQPDSPAFQLGFQPIPVEQIGPYESAERASWPIAEAPGAREAGFDRATIETQAR